MASRHVYLVIGIGVDVNGGGDRGDMCQTWPDCPAGQPVRVPGNGTPFDANGYISVKGNANYGVVGGTSFDTSYAAQGWLDHDPDGQAFKASFLNVIVVRGSVSL